jgi:hypothetical protein
MDLLLLPLVLLFSSKLFHPQVFHCFMQGQRRPCYILASLPMDLLFFLRLLLFTSKLFIRRFFTVLCKGRDALATYLLHYPWTCFPSSGFYSLLLSFSSAGFSLLYARAETSLLHTCYTTHGLASLPLAFIFTSKLFIRRFFTALCKGRDALATYLLHYPWTCFPSSGFYSLLLSFSSAGFSLLYARAETSLLHTCYTTHGLASLPPAFILSFPLFFRWGN